MSIKLNIICNFKLKVISFNLFIYLKKMESGNQIIIKKILKFIIFIIIIKIDLRNIAPWYSNNPLDKSQIQQINIEWMYYLNDSIDIRKLSIPGTHDSCASIFLN